MDRQLCSQAGSIVRDNRQGEFGKEDHREGFKEMPCRCQGRKRPGINSKPSITILQSQINTQGLILTINYLATNCLADGSPLIPSQYLLICVSPCCLYQGCPVLFLPLQLHSISLATQFSMLLFPEFSCLDVPPILPA